MSEWKNLTLKEAGVTLIDCEHKTPEAQSDGIPYIGIPQLKNGHISFESNPRLISEEDYVEWTKKAKPKHNDVILSRRTNPGVTAYVPANKKFALGQNLVLMRSNGEIVFPEYLRWLLQGPNWWGQVEKFLNVGAVFDSLRISDIPKFELPIPPLSEQKAIAHILGTLDQKIELNRQMNQTLEAMAQALFKSWFVDFDPVLDNLPAEEAGALPDALKAKYERRKALPDDKKLLHTNPNLAAQFPASFVFNETLGKWIPEGWEVKSFGEVSKCFDSKRVPLSKKQREEKQPGNYPYYGATSINDYINEYIFDDTFLLLGEDGSVVKEDGTPYTQYVWGKIWVNNHAHVLQGSNGISTEHLLTFIKNEKIGAYVTGAVQMKLNQGNMNRIPFLMANPKINKEFSYHLNRIYSKYKINYEQTETLIELRDKLLPELISGRVRVSEIVK